MVTVAVIERTAEGRNFLTEELTALLHTGQSLTHLVPQVSIIPLSIQELKFRETPNICIVGQQLCEHTPQEIRTIKKLFPECLVIARLTDGSESITRVDELLGYGADDTFTGPFSSPQLFKYVIQAGRSQRQKKKGTVILVDSGKGGIGTTSLAAGLADVLSLTNKKIALIDLDFETQDLSRFLRLRPLLNEQLDLILSQQRPLLAENIEQCFVPFPGSENIRCFTPPAIHHDFLSVKCKETQIFFSLLKIIDEIHDIVVIDAGAARGGVLEMLYRVSDKIVFAVNNDPATLHASVEKLQSMIPRLSDNEVFTLVNNAPDKDGISENALKREYLQLTGLSDSQWLSTSIPRCSAAKTWPGSGETLLSMGKLPVAYALEVLAEKLGFPLAETNPKATLSFTKNLSDTLTKFKVYGTKLKPGGNERSLHLGTAQDPSRPALPSPESLKLTTNTISSDNEQSIHNAKQSKFKNHSAAELVSAVEFTKPI
jgi:cellulose biosynthesis protein BcsQ